MIEFARCRGPFLHRPLRPRANSIYILEQLATVTHLHLPTRQLVPELLPEPCEVFGTSYDLIIEIVFQIGEIDQNAAAFLLARAQHEAENGTMTMDQITESLLQSLIQLTDLNTSGYLCTNVA